MRYYFYTLNETRMPEHAVEYYEEANDAIIEGLKTKNMLLSHTGSLLRQNLMLEREEYEFQNGQDARYFIRYGVKETDEEGYNQIADLDKSIVSRFNQKTLDLMDKFGHRKDGWHFPFYVDAESRSHLKWKLKQMFPEYEEFIFKD